MSHSPPPPYSEQDSYPVKAPLQEASAPPLANNGMPPPPVPPPPSHPAPAYSAPLPGPLPPTSVSSTTTTITVSPVVIQTPLFGAFPVETDCRYCQAHIVTHTKKVAGALPWIVMGICFVLGFFLIIPWCICCIPFCIDSFLDVLHTCPSCKRTLGRFSRI